MYSTHLIFALLVILAVGLSKVSVARAAVNGSSLRDGWDDALPEWFMNDQHGLEQGCTLLQRPKGRGKPLHTTLATRGGLSSQVSGDGRDLTFVIVAGMAVVDYVALAEQRSGQAE